MNDAYTAAWLQEMWGTCPEVSRGERLAKRTEDRREQRQLEEWELSAQTETDRGAA